eukprot:1659592-Amphidinium_carterae.2
MLAHMLEDLIAEYTKRANNHQQLLGWSTTNRRNMHTANAQRNSFYNTSNHSVLKLAIKASKLRIGNAKTRVVAACRQVCKCCTNFSNRDRSSCRMLEAIKKNNIHELFQIIKTGQDPGTS